MLASIITTDRLPIGDAGTFDDVAIGTERSTNSESVSAASKRDAFIKFKIFWIRHGWNKLICGTNFGKDDVQVTLRGRLTQRHCFQNETNTAKQE
jgi:hypothetical protein